MASAQAGLWELVRSRPRSLRAAVRGTIANQLGWVEEHPDLARFVYSRGHLDWDSPGNAEVSALNRDLGTAFRDWMAPLVERGEIRPVSLLMITAIVNGPAHAIAQRWLAGHLDAPLTDWTDELTDAACAALRGTRVRARAGRPPAPASRGRVTRATVRRVGDAFVVNGVKGVTSGIEMAERVLVLGRVPGEREEGAPPQFTTVLIDPGAPGVERTELPMRGREGVRQWQIALTDVVAPAEALVGTEGQGLLTLWPFTHVERLLTAALCVGSAQHCLSRALGRARERTVFGTRPIGAEQAIQHPLAGLHARLEATRLFVHRASARFDSGADQLAVAGEANMAKVLGADLLYDAADHAVQTLGALAWDEREGMVDLFLDARLARSGPVSQELALNFIAQHVLGLPNHR